MSQTMQQLFKDRIVSGLKRVAITKASKWAETYRVMGVPFPGLFSFKHHPWLREMHDSKSESNVGQKAAQMGYTETMLNLTFFNIDVLRRDCLYVLPAKTPDASDFSSGRFAPALELSEHLQKLFSDTDNVGHKRAGSVSLYIRGSKSRPGLKSIPVAFLVLDEVDEMDQDNIPLAEERQSGQVAKQDWKISTPTIDNVGINKYFQQSTQEHFFFPCPSCSRHIELVFPDNLVRTSDDPNHPDLQNSYLICDKCKATLPHNQKTEFLGKGIWVPQKQDTDKRGFYINQLYSPAVTPAKIAELFLRSQSDLAAEQEFFNSKLGQTHVVSGARVTDEAFDKCIVNHTRHYEGYYQKRDRIITMGIDVGKFLHWEIDEWLIHPDAVYGDINSGAIPKIIGFGKALSFDQLDVLWEQFGVHFAVIDSQPERRKSFEFVQRHYGQSKMCIYTKGGSGRTVVPSPEIDQAINVDRTAWLDMSLGRFQRGTHGILIPRDVDLEYRDQIKAQVRVYEKDNDNNAVGRYLTPTNMADHYGHARNYAEIALHFAVNIGSARDISSPL